MNDAMPTHVCCACEPLYDRFGGADCREAIFAHSGDRRSFVVVSCEVFTMACDSKVLQELKSMQAGFTR